MVANQSRNLRNLGGKSGDVLTRREHSWGLRECSNFKKELWNSKLPKKQSRFQCNFKRVIKLILRNFFFAWHGKLIWLSCRANGVMKYSFGKNCFRQAPEIKKPVVHDEKSSKSGSVQKPTIWASCSFRKHSPDLKIFQFFCKEPCLVTTNFHNVV